MLEGLTVGQMNRIEVVTTNYEYETRRRWLLDYVVLSFMARLKRVILRDGGSMSDVQKERTREDFWRGTGNWELEIEILDAATGE